MFNLPEAAEVPVTLIYGLFAIFGGIARYLSGYVNGHKFTFGIFIASAIVSAFSGVMFGLLGRAIALPDTLVFVMAGTGGFFGEQTMKLILEYFERRIK